MRENHAENFLRSQLPADGEASGELLLCFPLDWLCRVIIGARFQRCQVHGAALSRAGEVAGAEVLLLINDAVV